MLHDLVGGLLDLLAPPTCSGCELSLGSAELIFCSGCSALLEPPPPSLRLPSDEAAVFCFQGPLADAIRRFKYGGAFQLGTRLGALLLPAATHYLGRVDAVVPMPLHPRKLRVRGFNPAVLLAGAITNALQVPLHPTWLLRTRHTHSQAGLSGRARAENVCGAFAAKPVAACRILLLDDVRTTGATAAEAAAVLRARGHTVRTLALAWAPPS